MSVSDRVCLPRAVGAVGVVGVVGVAALASDEPLTPLAWLAILAGTVYVSVSALRVVRDHHLFDIVEALVLAGFLAGWWLSFEGRALVPGVVVVLALLNVARELYTYRTDTARSAGG